MASQKDAEAVGETGDQENVGNGKIVQQEEPKKTTLSTPWSAVVKASAGLDVESEELNETHVMKHSSSVQSMTKKGVNGSMASLSSAEGKETVTPAATEQQQQQQDTESSATSSPGADTVSSGNKSSSKPAWKVPERSDEKGPAVPLPGSEGWPSLVDSKEPLPKKKQREQAAAAAASASVSSNEKQKTKKEKKGKGGDKDRDGEEKGGKGKGKSGRKKGGQGNKDAVEESNIEGRRQHRNSQRGNRQGFSQRAGNGIGYTGMAMGMPYGGLQPMMYPAISPVFYPPAAYGVPPAVMGMQGTNVDAVRTAVRNQIDYYFSPGNLVKDIYLRGKMDENGWVELQTIAAFNRVRMLTPDLSIIASSIAESNVVEASPDGLFLRVANGWGQWVLPEGQRDPNIKSPELKGDRPAQSMTKSSGKGSVNEEEKKTVKPKDEDDLFQLDEEHESGQSTMTDADVSRLIVVKPSARRKKESFATESVDDDMKSVIHDGLELYGKELRSISEKSGGPASKATSVPRPVANGRKNARNKVNANFYPASLSHSYTGKSKNGKMGNRPKSVAVGWVLGSTPVDSHGVMSPSHRGRSGSYLGSSAPIQKFQHPSYELLEDNGFTQIKYEKFHDRCIEERSEKGIGHSEEMNTLFRFWCYFLRDHFNTAMYEDFKKYALEDSKQGYHYGIECLFRFYSYGLESHFREDLYKEFEQLVLDDHRAGHLYGLEKFWAFHHYHGFPKDCKLHMHPELEKLLETEYKSLEDFKAKNAKK